MKRDSILTCPNCNNTIYFSEIRDIWYNIFNDLYYIKCPACNKKIWGDF